MDAMRKRRLLFLYNRGGLGVRGGRPIVPMFHKKVPSSNGDAYAPSVVRTGLRHGHFQRAEVSLHISVKLSNIVRLLNGLRNEQKLGYQTVHVRTDEAVSTDVSPRARGGSGTNPTISTQSTRRNLEGHVRCGSTAPLISGTLTSSSTS
jgi:hypothetical protein